MPRSLSSLQMTVSLIAAMCVTQVLQPAVADEPEPRRRTLEVEVLIQSQPSYRIKSQEWGRVFQELGYSVKFREPRGGEAARIEDLDRDDFLATRVVAAMAADGSLRIGKQKFDIESTKLLTQSLDEIQRHGAKGPPDDSPTWGLTDEQFKEVTSLLGVPVENPVELQSSILGARIHRPSGKHADEVHRGRAAAGVGGASRVSSRYHRTAGIHEGVGNRDRARPIWTGISS